jgi:type II secretory pathway component GspD/PulD (secretin)
LPLVGVLFRNTQKVVKNSELLVLLSPHIYKGDPVPKDVMDTYNKIKDRPMLSLPKDKDTD